MTAAYLAFTDSLLGGLARESAAAKVDYLEEALARGEQARDEADSALSEFMTLHGVFEIESQAKAAFQIIGALTARISILEVTRAMMSEDLRNDAPDIKRLDMEIEMLRGEIEKALSEGDDGALFPSLADMPGLATEYLGMVAERMAREFSLAFLRLKLEDARISSASDVGVIRVIDPPVVPERRAWPKRKQIVIILTLASVLWTSFVILVRERSAGSSPDSEGSGPARVVQEEAD
jgi:capsule polysaccharide export protein KpsE/RkpR